MKGWPRKRRELWSDSDYARAIECTEVEREQFRARYGHAREAEAVFARSLVELTAEREALRVRHAQFTTRGDDGDDQAAGPSDATGQRPTTR